MKNSYEGSELRKVTRYLEKETWSLFVVFVGSFFTGRHKVQKQDF